VSINYIDQSQCTNHYTTLPNYITQSVDVSVKDLGKESNKSTAGAVRGTEQIVSKLLNSAAVERLMTTKETGKQTEIRAVFAVQVTRHFKH